jgi:hypothetical protein
MRDPEQQQLQAAARVETLRESAANFHPLQSSSSGAENDVLNKNSSFAARINPEMSIISSPAATRRQPSLSRKFGPLEVPFLYFSPSNPSSITSVPPRLFMC